MGPLEKEPMRWQACMPRSLEPSGESHVSRVGGAISARPEGRPMRALPRPACRAPAGVPTPQCVGAPSGTRCGAALGIVIVPFNNSERTN